MANEASDSDLIARALIRDDRAAFGELVVRHQSEVRRFLRHLTGGDAAMADDLAQETFVRAYRSLSRFRGNSRFLTWLFGIAHNVHRNARRAWKPVVPFEAGEPAAESSDPPTRSVDLREDLEAAMKKLTPDEQTSIHLFYHQGLSHTDIASVAGWPLGTVKTHLARAKEKLRTLLRSWNPQN